MEKRYKTSELKEYIYDSEQVDIEVKKIIEQKEQEGMPLGELCELLKRESNEIQRILGRRYKNKILSYLRKW